MKTVLTYIVGGVGIFAVSFLAHSLSQNATYKVDNLSESLYEQAYYDEYECFGAKAISHQDKCGNSYGKRDPNVKLSFNSFGQTYAQRNIKRECEFDAFGQQLANKDVFCEFGDEGSNKLWLVMGDSYSQQEYGALDVSGKKLNVRMIGVNSISCGGGITRSMSSGKTRPGNISVDGLCRDRYDWIKEKYFNHDIAGVIIGTSGYYYNNEEFVRGAKNTIDVLHALDIPIVLLQSIPNTLSDDCLFRRDCVVDMASDSTMNLLYERLSVDGYSSKVQYMAISDLFCDGDGKCHSQIGGMPVYYNPAHINSFYSISMGGALTEKLRKAGL